LVGWLVGWLVSQSVDYNNSLYDEQFLRKLMKFDFSFV